MATTQAELALRGDTRPLAQMLSNPNTMARFEMACGKQAGEIMVNIINAANSNPDIWECEPMTTVTAALNAATMHLSLSPSLGQACILPFNKNYKTTEGWKSEKRAQLVVMLRGVKDMAMRTNKYRVLNAFAVYQGQMWTENQMTGVGAIEGKRTSDKAIGYGAYLVLFSGFEATTYMTVEELTAHAQKYSPTFNKKDNKFSDKSRWVTDFDEQCRKTVLKKLILNKGVINESDRSKLEEIESEHDDNIVDGTVEENAAAMDKVLQKEAEQEADEIERDFPQISAEEAAYLSAKEVKTPKGTPLDTVPDKELGIFAASEKYPEVAKAAAAIMAYRKYKAAIEAKTMSELGY